MIINIALNKILATIYPPTNVRVQATSNTSAVVQWDLDSDRSVDGFVVRYIHEPISGQHDNERWKTITIMNPSARHLHISQLTAHKPYAFCVLAIRQNVSVTKIEILILKLKFTTKLH